MGKGDESAARAASGAAAVIADDHRIQVVADGGFRQISYEMLGVLQDEPYHYDTRQRHGRTSLCRFRAHESYDHLAMETTDDNLMRSVLSPPIFPFLDDLRSSSRLRTFEEILGSAVDEDEDYQWLTEMVVMSSLWPRCWPRLYPNNRLVNWRI